MNRWMPPFSLASLAPTAALALVLMGCGGAGDAQSPDAEKAAGWQKETPKAGKKANGPNDGKSTKGKAEAAPTKATVEKLVGGPFPALVIGQAWFTKNEQGKPVPGPARMQIWRDQGNDEWVSTTVEDPDSNVFHKILVRDNGSLITIGAEGAILKRWTFENDEWKQEKLWENTWGGRFNRLRDIEAGDVDGDGKEEFVIATHDGGVIAVYNLGEPDGAVVELDAQKDIFVHEIEIGDIDGDAKLEFYATPTGRNKVGESQPGGIVQYKWNGTEYVKTVVEQKDGTHAKEILVADVNGDGKDELYGVFEAELDAKKQIKTPVQIRHYIPKPDGTFEPKVIAEIMDKQTRFLVAGDMDHDGKIELVAAAMKSGIWVLENTGPGTWEKTNIEKDSGGFEHVAFASDLNGDGKLELYVAADDQKRLARYVYNPETKSYDRTDLGRIPDGLTWNMDAGRL